MAFDDCIVGSAPVPCTCTTGAQGTQNCDASGKYSICSCERLGPMGGDPGAGGVVGSGGAVGMGGTLAAGGEIGASGAVGMGGGGMTGMGGTGGTLDPGTGGADPGTGGSSGGGGGPSNLPTVTGACPPMTSGTQTFNGVRVKLWAGPKQATPKGPLVFYWHGTGTNPDEATTAFGAQAASDVSTGGGLIASFETSTSQGTNTGTIWYTGDFEIADQIVACAIQELNIDPARIHSAGYSAGGLQTVWMAYARSNYIASIVSYSGGLHPLAPSRSPQDPSNTPAAVVAHGAPGSDALGLDFAQTSASYEADLTAKGAFGIDCNDGGAHIDIFSRFAISAQAWQFIKDHPYKTPSPYAGGLPSGWPDYCHAL